MGFENIHHGLIEHYTYLYTWAFKVNGVQKMEIPK